MNFEDDWDALKVSYGLTLPKKAALHRVFYLDGSSYCPRAERPEHKLSFFTANFITNLCGMVIPEGYITNAWLDFEALKEDGSVWGREAENFLLEPHSRIIAMNDAVKYPGALETALDRRLALSLKLDPHYPRFPASVVVSFKLIPKVC